MAGIWRQGSDNLKNGAVLGLLLGILLASSNITWIRSIVNMVVDAIPSQYSFEYIGYLVWGFLGGLAGYLIDRR